MRQLWVGIIVVVVALILGVSAAFGASLLVRNRLVNLPSGQPGNNSRRFNNPFTNPGGQQGNGPYGYWNWGGNGPMMGPGMRGFGNFNNCPVPEQGQPQSNCLPFRRFNGPATQATPTAPAAPGSPTTPVAPATPATPNDGSNNGPF